MKNFLMVCAFLISAWSLSVDAQNTQYKNVIKISPVQFANSTFELNYERYFNDKKQSVVLSPALLLRENGAESLVGFKALVQHRFYFTHLHKGTNNTWGMSNVAFYGGSYVQFLNAKEDYWGSYNDGDYNYYTEIFEKDISSIEGGVLLGMQVDIIPRLVLDFYLGGGIKYAEVEDTLEPFLNDGYSNSYGVLDKEYTGVVPRASIQFGFNF